MAATVEQVIPATAEAKPVEIWFQDEARIGQKGTLAYVWVRRGPMPAAHGVVRWRLIDLAQILFEDHGV